MTQPSIDGLVNAGEDLLGGIAELAQHRGVERGMALLMGQLDGATVRSAPGTTPIVLTGQTWLVQGTASIDGPEVALNGVVSWDDRGIPRVVAGRIDAARSGTVRVQLLPTAQAAAETAPPALPPVRPTRVETPPARPTRSARPKPSAADDRLDLTDAVPTLPTASKGWGAAVAASKGNQTRAAAAPASAPAKRPEPAAESAPAGGGSKGGWGAAVAASRTAPAARPSRTASRAGRPSPDELGFDAPPTLMAGDILMHPRFGRCIVSRMVGKSKVKLRRPSGGLFDLHLKVCRFVREPDEGSKRVFSVTIGR